MENAQDFGKLEHVAVERLAPTEDNPRAISAEQMSALAQSIRDNPDFFTARPILAVERAGAMRVIGGNQRLAAAKKIGMREVPVFVFDGEKLTPARERDFVLRDNYEFGAWDFAKIRDEWRDVALADAVLEDEAKDFADDDAPADEAEKKYTLRFSGADAEDVARRISEIREKTGEVFDEDAAFLAVMGTAPDEKIAKVIFREYAKK